MIDVTGIDLVELAKEAYRLSVPQGLGLLHFTPEPLSNEEARSLVRPDDPYPLDMDYCKGRSIKLHVRKERNGRLTLDDSWYDHTDDQYRRLLNSVGIVTPDLAPQFHGHSCNCKDCIANRGK
jgi:hypothetical protein